MSTALAARFFPEDDAHKKSQLQIEMELTDCLSCGANDSDTVIVASDPVTGLGGNFRVVRCRGCDLVYTNPRPTQACIGQFYPDDYLPYASRDEKNDLLTRFKRKCERAVLEQFYGYPASSNSLSRFYATLGKLLIRRSRQRQSWIPYRSPGRLLDFGCGAGYFLKEMKGFGWDVQGLDFSPEVAQKVFEESKIKVHVGTLPHPEVKEDSFDAVTMWNSLEHVYDPRQTIAEAGRLLRQRGVLVIGVPNFDSWGYETFQQDWQGLELPRHLTHFTPETLQKMVEDRGFRTLELNHIARVGWIRSSARRATKHDRGGRFFKMLAWKPFGIRIAERSEKRKKADFIRIVAEKI